ncbi:MAG: Hpt domain-containing protein [Pseudobutyrivibrio sp.]|nr:Hpt domain-containing protein [Pseudobutyrivibrio sp.]
MLTIEVLRQFGANVDEGLERCMGDGDFYLELIPDALVESYYKSIEDLILSNDYHQAFEVAHSLKGILSNLALTPILEPVSEITEGLRANKEMDYSPYISDMWAKRNKLLEMIG